MTCHCATPQEHANRAADQAYASAESDRKRLEATAAKEQDALNKRIAELASRTPNPDQFEIEEVEPVGEHLVLKVKYPNCAKCAYEGHKILVILNAGIKDAIKWRRIDPHFRQNAGDHKTAHPKDAPSPAARFPGSREGWIDAMEYARGKTTTRTR